MDWFRSYHGAPTDPKWIVIANKAQSKPGVVAAVWWYLMDIASQASVRGSVAGFDAEVCCAAYGFPEEEIRRVVDALREKRLITPDHLLSTWTKRNPPDYSTERVRRFRQKQTEMKRDETEGNGVKRPETQNRTEKNRSNSAKPKGWVAVFCDAWIARFGGTAHGGRIGKALRPLVEQHGEVAVLEAWRLYLDAVEPDYAAPETFASKYGVWSGTAKPPAKIEDEITDVKMLIKAAGTKVFNAFTRDEGFKQMATDCPAAWRRLESVMRKIRYGDLKDAAEARNGIEYTNLLKAQLREIQDAA
jgi:hypothetical protein